MRSSLKSSHSVVVYNQTVQSSSTVAADSGVVLAREAGVPFQPLLTDIDPFVEWLSLMEVVQMLCPAWPVRDRPMLGKIWKL
jgi:hypothetical protein